MGVFDADLSNLTLPRTFFGRSEINGYSFRNADLAESSLCWNDFIEVDFSAASLTNSDLRASRFEDCRFICADLRGCDLRDASFPGSDFDGAEMKVAIVARIQRNELDLEDKQCLEIDWRDDAGPEPPGG